MSHGVIPINLVRIAERLGLGETGRQKGRRGQPFIIDIIAQSVGEVGWVRALFRSFGRRPWR